MQKVHELMKELDLELDDVRWYLSVNLAETLLKYQTSPRRLIEEIWSGKLGDTLFQMEERYLEELENSYQKHSTDEAHLREFFSLVRRSKRNRWIQQQEKPS